MLYSLFIYQTESGLLLWEKSFEKQMDSHRMELFSSFFSAIQSFVKELVTAGSKGLKNIEMGNFTVSITNIPKIELDIVEIADTGDEKSLQKLTPKIIKVLKSHKQLFMDWDGDRDRFKVLDLEILQLIQSTKGLIGDKSILDSRSEILTKIVDHLPELEKGQKDHYLQERSFLFERFNKTTNILDKLDILNSIDELSQKLKDKEAIRKNERDRKRLYSELNSTKERMKFFLSGTKEAISKAVDQMGAKSIFAVDFKDAYISLYSFSTKLKIIGRDDLSEEYRKIAQILIDKPENKREEFTKIITSVLNLSDDIESYIK